METGRNIQNILLKASLLTKGEIYTCTVGQQEVYIPLKSSLSPCTCPLHRVNCTQWLGYDSILTEVMSLTVKGTKLGIYIGNQTNFFVSN